MCNKLTLDFGHFDTLDTARRQRNSRPEGEFISKA